RESLSAAEVNELLTAYRIPVAEWRVVNNADEAVEAAGQIGYPVVIKVDTGTIEHKSGVGGVAVDIRDGNATRSAVEDMKKRLAVGDLRFLVQKYLPCGKEIIVGAKSEKNLGHLIMFGIGGIYVEVLKDVAFGITPITEYEARDMISSIRSYLLLEGFRGEKGVDREKLVEVLQRASQLVTDLPMIREMDLNPIIAYEDRVFVVDARIRI
ncbi:MAG: acetate--CoA ligase family protein, partial [Thermoplasmata archaeon]|nr:acetate--CoA ligase family protein [Thermoplasmata archaeon]